MLLLVPVAIVVFVRYYLSVYAHEVHEVQQNVHELTYEVQQLEKEQAMPVLVLKRYRNSICYIVGVYQVGFSGRAPTVHAHVSGTGFVVADGLVVTNRHVAEPWYKAPVDTALLRKGAKPNLEKLVAFFPGMPEAVNISQAVLSAQGDLAVLRIQDSDAVHQLRPVPLAHSTPKPGELVVVVGYPMGVFGMVEKSPPAVYERLVLRRDDQVAPELAALSLIRPSATCGHLGDVVGEKLVYDAPTAPGASGGPVFNSGGEVIGVNAAYMDGYAGGTLGVSVHALLPLISIAGTR
ncbi:MAG TPA: serine protease [Terriglobales bacterium]|nr:serine protease [Terriglobales bacterium]